MSGRTEGSATELRFRLVNVTRPCVVASRVIAAGSAVQRLLGLVGRRTLADGEGLWLRPCNGIHTFGVRFPLDVLVLDRGLRVVAVWPGVRPMRVRWPVRGGHSTVELAAGALARAGIRVGDQVAFDPVVGPHSA